MQVVPKETKYIQQNIFECETSFSSLKVKAAALLLFFDFLY